MKKIAFICLIILITCTTFMAGCSNDTQNINNDVKAEDIVGYWGRSGKVMHTFESDGTCIIGGIVGTYQISEDFVLTTTPNGGDAMVFLYSDSEENIENNEWFLKAGEKLYINGSQFSWIGEIEDITSEESND